MNQDLKLNISSYNYARGYRDAVMGLESSNDDRDYLLGYDDGEDSISEFGFVS